MYGKRNRELRLMPRKSAETCPGLNCAVGKPTIAVLPFAGLTADPEQ
jgi:hypothetical protein